MNSFCWIAYHTTCSCKKLLFTMEINWRAGRQKLANFKVIFDLFISCFYFIQQQKYKLYYVTLMIISEIQSKRAHWSCYSSKVKAPADLSHHAILATWISLKCQWQQKCLYDRVNPDQTAPIGAVWSGSILFASILKFVSKVRQLLAADDLSRRHFQMHFFLPLYGLRRVQTVCRGYQETTLDWYQTSK